MAAIKFQPLMLTAKVTMFICKPNFTRKMNYTGLVSINAFYVNNIQNKLIPLSKLITITSVPSQMILHDRLAQHKYLHN